MKLKYCAIGINKNNKGYTSIAKIQTKDISILLTFDLTICFVVLETKTNKNVYDDVLDYWFGTHDEISIANRVLNKRATIMIDKSKLLLIKNQLIELQELMKNVDDKLLKDELINKSTEIYRGLVS